MKKKIILIFFFSLSLKKKIYNTCVPESSSFYIISNTPTPLKVIFYNLLMKLSKDLLPFSSISIRLSDSLSLSLSTNYYVYWIYSYSLSNKRS